jgi:hypothetical protein
MDTIVSAAPPQQHVIDWDSVFAEVNAWRGSCLHQFSMVEMAVSETLLALSKVSPGGDRVKLRHLIGQRLEDLSTATAPKGPFEEATAQRDLLRYREEHEAFRNLLCHGVVTVAVQRNGQWLLGMRLLSFRSGDAERNSLALDQSQALARLDAIRRDAQRLSSVLGQLRKTMAQ